MKTPDRTLLLFGPNGFVGPWITRAALKAGWRVIGLSRHPVVGTIAASTRYVPVVADVTEAAAGRQWIETADAVVFNAGYLPSDYAAASEAERCLAVNALAPLAVLRQLAEKPRPFIYVSNGQGYQTGGPASERALLFPAGRASYYLGSKLAGDLYTEHHRIAHGVPAAVLRLGSLYGPGQQRGMVARFVQQACRGEPIQLENGGEHAADLTFVADAAQAAMSVLSRGATGIFNIGSGKRTTAKEAARQILAAAGRKDDLLRVGPRQTPARNGFQALDIARARRELAFVPTSPEEGLRRTVRAASDL